MPTQIHKVDIGVSCDVTIMGSTLYLKIPPLLARKLYKECRIRSKDKVMIKIQEVVNILWVGEKR